MRRIFIMLLSMVLASAVHAQGEETEKFPVEAFCAGGKLIGLRMEVPSPGTVPIPLGVCDAAKTPAAPPVKPKASEPKPPKPARFSI